MWFGDRVKPPHNPEVTLYIPFSREWVFDKFKRQMLDIEMPYAQTEVVVLLDSKNLWLRDKWLELLRLMRMEKPWNGLSLYMTGEEPLDDRAHVHYRRQRIMDLKEKSKRVVSASKYVYSIEDDTFVAADTYSRLIRHIRESVGLVTAVEAGRWGIKMVGVWEIEDDENGQPLIVRTKLPPDEPFVEEIQGSGWYCYITRVDLFKKLIARDNGEPMGVDVCYCYDVTKEGYKALVDWSIHCQHHTKQGEVILPDGVIEQVEWKNFEGKWFRKREKVVSS